MSCTAPVTFSRDLACALTSSLHGMASPASHQTVSATVGLANARALKAEKLLELGRETAAKQVADAKAAAANAVRALTAERCSRSLRAHCSLWVRVAV